MKKQEQEMKCAGQAAQVQSRAAAGGNVGAANRRRAVRALAAGDFGHSAEGLFNESMYIHWQQ